MTEKRGTVVLLDYAAIAQMTGIDVAMLRHYMNRGKMPVPDYRIAQSPGWLPETIHDWMATFTPEGLPPVKRHTVG
jgi:predicted DNA-binding transcriptional regulator AlpA